MKKVVNDYLINKFLYQFKISEFIANKENLELVLFEKGDYICKDNEELQYIYFFVKGKAKIYRILENGKASLICFYDGFSIIGDLELIREERTSMNIKVLEDSYCFILPISIAKELMKDSKFLFSISKSLGEKLYKISQNSSINVTYPLENRLASYILATNNEELKENLIEISELLGSSYRHLLRTLKVLGDKGVIKKSKEGYKVIDLIKLEKLAGDLYK